MNMRLLAAVGIGAVFLATTAVAQTPLASGRITLGTNSAIREFPGTYTPLDASRDSHARAEQGRRQAIDRQLQANATARLYGVYAPGYYLLPAPYPPGRFARNRYLRRLAEGAIVPPALGQPILGQPAYVLPGLGQVVPSPLHAEPFPLVEQPLGHKRIWTGPNSYIYHPVYPSDLRPPSRPMPAPQPPPTEVIPAPPADEAIPTPRALPESISTPAPEWLTPNDHPTASG